MKKIFITGCAKSGTTLLKDLFWAFESTFVCPGEVTIYDFCKLTKNDIGPYNYVVAKRSTGSIFSDSKLTLKDIRRQIELIRMNNVVIINIIRDGRNVVKSMVKDWDYYNPFEWMECIRQYKDYNSYLDVINIRYEDLLECPEEAQTYIGARLGLNDIYPFTQYPGFIQNPEPRHDNYEYRPIDPDKAKEVDNITYLSSPNDIDYFEQLLKLYNYKICVE